MQRYLKRALDLSVAAGALVLLAPFLALVAVAVRASSPGPVLFRQRRIGRGGEPFWLYKFRTMRQDAGGPAITSAGDRRITPAGAWLRHWKLDELPQLYNVLRGDMSLVGPRPEVPHYVRLYDEEQRQVLAARPGITGPSQIEFRHEERLLAAHPDPEAFYTTTLLPAKLAMDLQYVRSAGLLRDLRLLARTLGCLWNGVQPLPLGSEPVTVDGAATGAPAVYRPAMHRLRRKARRSSG
jgi:lipopolysaccharide/colanic/teichoic acid biosynthesis glycosyltransferase